MKFIFLTIAVLLFFIDCNQESHKTIKIAGNAQGTTWQITWLSENNLNYKEAIDSIFKRIDLSLSTYIPTSIISRINKNDTSFIADNYFIEVFNKSIEVSEKTKGLFDVTVAPVINAWGFGFTKKAEVDSAMIDSLLDFIGYEMVRLEGKKLIKEKPQVMLDFNAIAQGYSVDVLASYLESKGIINYLVELGGEVKAKGKKYNEEFWTIGIDQPNENPTDGRPLKAIVKLKDRALATSGNYRRFYEENGKKYAHIIDPFTGYPAKNNLLSATVLADDCMTADAYATALMVMGLEKSKQFLSEHKELSLEVFFIYDENGDWKTYASETLKEWVEEVP
ncbi:MAG: FAD:protein FMN transferase [Chitinophagaceae bacterium]|nr:FAD:protein FMN transferase [Chitinophagaceae bacterium]